jgi:hypothetical protein
MSGEFFGGNPKVGKKAANFMNTVSDPLVYGIEKASNLASFVKDYLGNAMQSHDIARPQSQPTAPPPLTQQQVDEINVTPGFGMARRKALWDVMQGMKGNQ